MAAQKHPSAQARFQLLCKRFLKLQQEHRRASDAMWAGTLASAFTDDELTILQDYTCPNDVRLLQRVRQPQMSATGPQDHFTFHP